MNTLWPWFHIQTVPMSLSRTSLVCAEWPNFMVQATTNQTTTCSVSRKKRLGRKLLCTDTSTTLHIHQSTSPGKISKTDQQSLRLRQENSITWSTLKIETCSNSALSWADVVVLWEDFGAGAMIFLDKQDRKEKRGRKNIMCYFPGFLLSIIDEYKIITSSIKHKISHSIICPSSTAHSHILSLEGASSQQSQVKVSITQTTSIHHVLPLLGTRQFESKAPQSTWRKDWVILKLFSQEELSSLGLQSLYCPGWIAMKKFTFCRDQRGSSQGHTATTDPSTKPEEPHAVTTRCTLIWAGWWSVSISLLSLCFKSINAAFKPKHKIKCGIFLS